MKNSKPFWMVRDICGCATNTVCNCEVYEPFLVFTTKPKRSKEGWIRSRCNEIVDFEKHEVEKATTFTVPLGDQKRVVLAPAKREAKDTFWVHRQMYRRLGTEDYTAGAYMIFKEKPKEFKKDGTLYQRAHDRYISRLCDEDFEKVTGIKLAASESKLFRLQKAS